MIFHVRTVIAIAVIGLGQFVAGLLIGLSPNPRGRLVGLSIGVLAALVGVLILPEADEVAAMMTERDAVLEEGSA